MATKTEKKQWNQLPEPWRHGGLFRNISNDLAVARQVGFVWDEPTQTWYIIVDGNKYWAYNTAVTYDEWADPYRLLGDKNPNNDPTFVFNATGQGIIKNDLYTPIVDTETGEQYYINELGQKIYGYNPNQNPQADAFITPAINENQLNLLNELNNFSDIVNDILGNPILPKTPEVGLYQTTEYFKELSEKKKLYKQFNSSKTEIEKIELIKVRGLKIVAEQNKLLIELNAAGAAIKRENLILNTVIGTFGATSQKAYSTQKSAGLATSILSKNPIGIGLAVTGAVKKYAATKTTGRREQLRSEDLLYLESELNAIKSYIEKNGVSSDGGGLENKNRIYWVIGGVVVLGIITYFIVKKWQS